MPIRSNPPRPPRPERRMDLVEALKTLRELREERIVVTTMGASREWPRVGAHPLDFHYLPSAMGHAPMIGLGMALAQPDREVLIFNGDGCMLMGMGCLATIVASGARNVSLVVLNNGIYEVTGGQQTAGAIAQIDYGGFAAAAGFATVAEYDDLIEWRREAADFLRSPGPRFVTLVVESVGDRYALPTMPPMSERIERFRQALAKL